MKIKGFIFSIPFLWVEGMAVFPFILLKTKNHGRFLINHERIHLKQQLELGIIVFYAWYFIEYLIRLAQYRKHYLAYLHISFEREAFQHQADLEYLEKRPFWAFLRYLRKT